ncbi:MAG TPA: hypothetical protein VJJ98_11030 [Sedimentisphaerales bacterium]|nr:hypothetical protein [Sedimentisphaerales bacterium]
MKHTSPSLALFIFLVVLCGLTCAYIAVMAQNPREAALFGCISVLCGFALTIAIIAAIIRWGSRANDIVEQLGRVESALHLMIVSSQQNRCDACKQIVPPDEITVTSIGKKICLKCARKITNLEGLQKQ